MWAMRILVSRLGPGCSFLRSPTREMVDRFQCFFVISIHKHRYILVIWSPPIVERSEMFGQTCRFICGSMGTLIYLIRSTMIQFSMPSGFAGDSGCSKSIPIENSVISPNPKLLHLLPLSNVHASAGTMFTMFISSRTNYIKRNTNHFWVLPNHCNNR